MQVIPQSINPDLRKERENSSFDVEEFAIWIHGGAENLQMKRLIDKHFFEGEFVDDDFFAHEYLSYEDIHDVAVRLSMSIYKKLKTIQDTVNTDGSEIFHHIIAGFYGYALSPFGNPLAVHVLMFAPTLRNQGTPEQYEKFGRRADNLDIIGTYAQTELGHGTFLRGLETRADYDRATDEFVLNTPTLTAYKWWPAGLGHTVNYCIVVAQLYIDNEPKGVQLFVLQVRDEETHKPLPGIDIGEIGRKVGLNGINNGFLGLKDVRIPRTNMLMKNAKVLPDGTFVQSPSAHLTYFPMVCVRVVVACVSCLLLSEAATIATRYSAVRRQSPINPNEPEPQIIDHVTQQLKLFPEIATAIAYQLACAHLVKLFNLTSKAMHNGDYSRLAELHALSCTLKATSTYDSSRGIERLRQACGGHGFMAAANLGNLFTYATAACTYEGENSVLYLQVGRILMRTWSDVLAGRELMPTMAYMGECAAWASFAGRWTGSPESYVQALQYTATNKTRVAFESLGERLAQGLTQPEALNRTGIELTQAAELHGRAFIAERFLREVTGPGAAQRSPQLSAVLERLMELYLVHTVLRHMNDILRFIELSEAEVAAVQRSLERLLEKLRPDAVAICDGFDFHNRLLCSVLGSYDGNVYERIFESAKNNPMNKQSVTKSFERYLKPLMKSSL